MPPMGDFELLPYRRVFARHQRRVNTEDLLLGVVFLHCFNFVLQFCHAKITEEIIPKCAKLPSPRPNDLQMSDTLSVEDAKFWNFATGLYDTFASWLSPGLLFLHKSASSQLRLS